MFRPLGVDVNEVDLEDVGGGVVTADVGPLFRVDFGAFEFARDAAVFAVELQEVVDPVAVAAAHHLHGDAKPLAHVDVHHGDRYISHRYQFKKRWRHFFSH